MYYIYYLSFFSQVGHFPSICGAESLSCLLDEITLIKHCNSIVTDNIDCKSYAVSKFRYFVLENSILLALFEEPLGNNLGWKSVILYIYIYIKNLKHLSISKACNF